MSRVLLAIDQLVERNNATYILEHFLALFPDAHIVTLAHKEKAIGGKIEMAPIYSTFLSNMVSSVDELKKKLFLIPGAVKGLELPSDFDFMISISSGFSHGFHIQGVKHYSYIYEWDYFFQGKVGLLSKLFKMYINGWRTEALESSNLLSLSNEVLAKSLNVPAQKIILPFFKADKILFNNQINPFEQDKRIVILVNEKVRDFSKISNIFANKAKQIFVLGSNTHTLGHSNMNYMGEMTQENISKYCENAWLTIDLSCGEFPEYSLAAMASGSPVLVRNNQINKEIIGELEGVFYFDQAQQIDLDQIKKSNLDRRKLRRKALRYNGRIFKSRNLRFLSDNSWFDR
jgi:hypothetical protein